MYPVDRIAFYQICTRFSGFRTIFCEISNALNSRADNILPDDAGKSIVVRRNIDGPYV